VRGAFERGEVNFRELFTGEAVMTFESNIAYTLRFMIDHHVRIDVQREEGKLMRRR
jgi:DNA polymerase delta subunit 1